jgi:hypothetical protein
LQQALNNYRAFGDSLRIFLLDPSTIAKSTCPKAYLKLLSLKGMKDGFKIHRELIFQLSSQLDGTFFNFGVAISALTIYNGEHISEFYSRTQELAREITIANLPDGNAASLLHQFLYLLRNTGDSTILGITNPYWTLITTFRRNPSHFTIPKLPWELHEVYAELEASGVTILTSSITSNNNPSSYIDDYGNHTNTTIDHPTPIAAYGTLPRPRIPLNNNNYHNNNSPNNNLKHHSTTSTNPTSTTQQNRRFTLHHTKTGKRFISEPPTSIRALCSLCFNKHPNPWHDTAHCPFKHTTHIIDKAIRERVMQHNALYGAENRHFTKSLDSPSTGTKSPPGHQSPATANCAITDTSTPD